MSDGFGDEPQGVAPRPRRLIGQTEAKYRASVPTRRVAHARCGSCGASLAHLIVEPEHLAAQRRLLGAASPS
jgi:hypothetical protein